MKETILGHDLKRVYAIYKGIALHQNNDLTVTVMDYKDGKETAKRPLSVKDLDFMKKMIQGNENNSYEVHERDFNKLIFFKQFPLKLIWKVPAERRKIQTTKGSQTVAFPKLLFILTEGKLQVCHYKKYEGEYKICPATNYPNTYYDHVCMGNVKTATNFGSVYTLIGSWESYYFNSKFQAKINDPKPPKNAEYIKLETR